MKRRNIIVCFLITVCLVVTLFVCYDVLPAYATTPLPPDLQTKAVSIKYGSKGNLYFNPTYVSCAPSPVTCMQITNTVKQTLTLVLGKTSVVTLKPGQKYTRSFALTNTVYHFKLQHQTVKVPLTVSISENYDIHADLWHNVWGSSTFAPPSLFCFSQLNPCISLTNIGDVPINLYRNGTFLVTLNAGQRGTFNMSSATTTTDVYTMPDFSTTATLTVTRY